MKTHVIQLETHDDVISIKDKMTWQSCRRIVLVWPKRGRIISSELDLVLLERTAKGLGAELALVTHHPVVREWALEKEIPIFASISAAERSAWRPTPATIQEKRIPRGVASVRNEKETLQKNSDSGKNPAVVKTAALILSLAALFSLFFVLVPSAKIVYYPEVRPQEIEIGITASENIGGVNPSGGIPAVPVYTEVSGELSKPSSGKSTVETEKAGGKVTLTNLTEQTLRIPKGTLVIANDGQDLFFSLNDDAILPAGIGKSVEARAEALLPGVEGNVESGKIISVAGEIGALVSVTNETAFSGGQSVEAPAPQESDYSTLTSQLLEQLKNEGLVSLAAELQPGSDLIDGSIQLEEILVEDQVNLIGSPSDEAVLRMTVRLKALIVQESDLKSIASLLLGANRPDGYQPLNDDIEIQRTGEVSVSQNGQASWTMKAYCLITPQWDANQAAVAMSGMRVKKAKAWFEKLFLQTQPADFKLIWPWMPFLSTRIQFINGAAQ